MTALAVALGAPPAPAANYTVSDSSTFSAAGVPAAILAGDTITLLGNASLGALYSIPAALSPLPADGVSIIGIGAPGGSILSLNNGGSPYWRFTAAGGAILNLSDLTITGGYQTQTATGGGAIYNSAGTLTINTDGAVSFSDNNVYGISTGSQRGGAIYSAGDITINGDLTANSNTAVTNFANGGGQGGAIYAGNGITINGALSADSNRATFVTGSGSPNFGSGGALYADTGNIIVTGNVTLTNNVARATTFNKTALGGGIYAAGPGASVKLATDGGNVTLTGNVAGNSGGAVATYASGGGSVSIGNAGNMGEIRIENNFAGYMLHDPTTTGDITIDKLDPTGVVSTGNVVNVSTGGAIYSAGTTTIEGSTIRLSNNAAQFSGGGIFSVGAVTITGALTANGNTAVYNSTNFLGSNNYDAGGAIYAGNGITINGSLTADSNRATAVGATANDGSGGALYANTGDIVVTGSASLTNNVAQGPADGAATGYGGAMYAADTGASVKLAANGGNVTLTGNVAGNSGGAVSTAATGAGSVSIANAGTIDIQNNFAGYTLSDPTYTGDIAFANVQTTGGQDTANGGAIYSAGTTTIDGSAIRLSGNRARAGGGALYAGGPVTITGALTAEGNIAGSGGAVYVDAGGLTLSGGTATFDSNTANRNGGAIYLNAAQTITATDLLLTNNTAGAEGGALYAGRGVTITGALTAEGNTAGSGGAIYVNAGGLTLSGGTAWFDSNTATGNGGAIYLNGPQTLTATDLRLTNNAATGYGGAIYAANGVTLNLSGSATFDNNAARYDGGAIYLNAAQTITATDLLLTNNTARNGGAIYANAGGLTLSGGTAWFDSNTATGYGGAIYAGNDVTLNLSGSATFDNNAAGHDGGAVYALGTVNLATQSGSVSLTDNLAGGGYGGGAIYASGAIGISNPDGTVAITGNSAGYTRTGAGTAADPYVYTNPIQAIWGGALYALGTTTVQGSEITLSGNRATGLGGAMYSGGDVNIGGDGTAAVTMDGNQAGSMGGAICSRGTTTIEGGAVTLTNNQVVDGNEGGAIYSARKLTLTGALTATDNTTTGSYGSKGGAIYAGNGVTFNLSGTSSITGNTADGFGGFLYAEAGGIVFNVGTGATATIGNNHSLLDATDSIATGTGVTFEKTGAGTLTLQNLNTIDGDATLSAGTLAIDQAGTLNATSYIQNAGATLNLTVAPADRRATDAFVTANTATLAGTINVNGFVPTTGFATASSVRNAPNQLLIQATGGNNSITGDFSTKQFNGVDATIALPDYIHGGIFKTANNTQVVAGVELSWFGDASVGHGTFTLANATDTFNVDVALADMHLGPYLSGWDGKTLTKEGPGTLLLTATNTYTGGTKINDGIVRIASTSTSSLTNLGSGEVSIAAPGTLLIDTRDAFVFDNALTGTGLLSASNHGNAFSFGANAGSAFQGTVALTDNTFALSGNNTTALTHATLVVGAGNFTTVSSGNPTIINTQTIGGLTIAGGTLWFNDDVLSDPNIAGIATGNLDVSGSGTIRVSLPNGFINHLPDAGDINSLPLLEQDSGNALSRLISATGLVTGDAGNLTLADKDGHPVTNGTVIEIVQNDFTVAKGTYDFRLSVASDGIHADGLYVNYGLTQVELLGTLTCTGNSTATCTNPTVPYMNNALTLTPADGATGLATDLSAKVTGAGDLEIDAPGSKVSLSNQYNDYRGQTLVTSGTLQLGSVGGTANGDETLLGKTSDLRVASGGIVDMNGFSQKVGALDTVAGGKVNITAGSTLTITDAQRAAGNPLGGGIDTNTIRGAGALVIDAGIVYVNGDQMGYTGLATVSGGSELVLNSASAYNSAAGIALATTADTLVFGDARAYDPAWTAIPQGTSSVAISGLGLVAVNNGSNVTLAGDNSGFAGIFRIDADSAMTVSAQKNLGTAAIDNAGLFTVDTDTNWTLANTLTGTGLLVKDGSGVLTVTGANLYTGQTLVTDGTLKVEGSIAPSFLTVVVDGAMLSGTGIVGNTIIETGGAFQPGNGTAGSAISVHGDLEFQPGATYKVNVDPATSSLATVSGAATLGGATVNAIYAPGSGYVEKRYTILTADGGVNGEFNNLVNTNLPAGFAPFLDYDDNNAYLNFKLSFTPPGGLNINQQNVADAIIDYFDRTGSIPPVFGALTPAGLTQASGELPTATQQTTFDAMNQFMGAITDAAGVGLDCAVCGDGAASNPPKGQRPADCNEPRRKVWATAYGGGRSTDGNAVVGSHDATGRVYGVAVGADTFITADTVAGFAVAGGSTNFDLADGLGSGRSDLFQAGVYARHHMGPAYLTGMLAYGWQDITTDRTVTVAGIDHLRADFNSNAFSGRLEGGWRFATAWGGFTPYAAGQFTTVDLPDYSERVTAGANTFALNYRGKTTTASRSELGLRADRAICLADGVLALRGRLAWAHDFDTDRDIAATLQTLPGASFTVHGAAIDHDAALVTVAAEMSWRNGWSVGLVFDGEFSDAGRSAIGRGVVRYRW